MKITYRHHSRRPAKGDVKVMKDGRVFVRHQRTSRVAGQLMHHVQHGRPVYDWRACKCYTCLDDPSKGTQNPATMFMVLCGFCENKRCPHGTSHTHACTHSNTPGQPGSRYGGTPASTEGGVMSALTITPEEHTILVGVNRSDEGQCTIGGNVHPDEFYSERSVQITFERMGRLERAGLMRRRLISGWRNRDFWQLTDAGFEVASKPLAVKS